MVTSRKPAVRAAVDERAMAPAAKRRKSHITSALPPEDSPVRALSGCLTIARIAHSHYPESS